MAFTNLDTKEINCKIVYFGPSAAGKTENLRSIYANSAEEMKSGLMELDDGKGSTKFFDFLPISLGYVKDYHIKLHLFSLPLSNLFETVTSVLLKGLDGIIFIADSRFSRLGANIEELEKTKETLKDEGYRFSDLPQVIQYNKRDLADVISVEALRKELNPYHVPEYQAIASQSVGTMETLHLMAKQVLLNLAPKN